MSRRSLSLILFIIELVKPSGGFLMYFSLSFFASSFSVIVFIMLVSIQGMITRLYHRKEQREKNYHINAGERQECLAFALSYNSCKETGLRL